MLRAHPGLAARVHIQHGRRLGDALEQRPQVAGRARCQDVLQRVARLEEDQQQCALQNSRTAALCKCVCVLLQHAAWTYIPKHTTSIRLNT